VFESFNSLISRETIRGTNILYLFTEVEEETKVLFLVEVVDHFSGNDHYVC
jgi:hypothetical protein